MLFVSENPSQALHKVSEIYDRIAFAAVGRYNEFENLRIAGVRLADMRGYSYDRRDVTGRGLANAYAQTLGTIFSSGGEKPYEVELFVAEIGDDVADDQIYRLTYDGQVADVQRYGVMGGAADVVAGYLEERYAEGASLEDAVRLAVSALGHTEEGDRVIPAEDLEVAVLDRTRSQPRKFVRVMPTRLGRAARRARSFRAQPGVRGRAHGRPGRRAGEPAVPVARRRAWRRRTARRSSRLSSRRSLCRSRATYCLGQPKRYPAQRVSLATPHTARSTARDVGWGTAAGERSRVRETSGCMPRKSRYPSSLRET